jgi:YidC/Oxa1 family membrane protein insertase
VFDALFDGLAWMLAFFYDLWPSYGGAIILFTLAIMLVLSPLSIKSTRSMIAMQRVSPEMKKLQQKYKDDREALNREMMAFYKANNINPFSSCLPLLLQMPVFIVLYRVLTGLTQKGGDGTFEPDYLDQGSSLYQALDTEREMRSFGMDLARGPLDVLQNDGFVTALPYLVLVTIVVGTTFYQQRQIAGRNPNAAANPQQQMIGRIMPLIFIPISLTISAGVVVYFAVSNLARVGQQALVTRLEYGKAATSAAAAPGAAKGERKEQGEPAAEEDEGAAKRTRPAPAKGTGKGGGKGGNGAGPARTPTNGARGNGARGGGGGSRARARNRKRKRK